MWNYPKPRNEKAANPCGVRLSRYYLAGQKVCQHKLSSPRMFDCIRTSYQQQRHHQISIQGDSEVNS